MYKIRLLPSANKDILEIIEFISKDNFFYANKVYDFIYKSFLLLQEFPLIGKTCSNGIREIVEGKYGFRIFYKIDTEEEIIYIIAVFKYKTENN